ncbi:hypothetical protein Tco_0133058 [Tanacetum coccineum]
MRNLDHEEHTTQQSTKKKEKNRASTHKQKVSTDKEEVSTDRSKVSTDYKGVSTDRPNEGTNGQTEGRNDSQTLPTTTTPSIFGDDETIAQVLIKMTEKKVESNLLGDDEMAKRYKRIGKQKKN